MIIIFFWLLISISIFSGLLYVQLAFGKPAKQKFDKGHTWMLVAVCLLWPAAVVFIVADAGVEKLTDWVNK